ncbi:MAG TPA: c-type cytochrome [Casimicrobiaceae bacterium]
MRPSSLAILAAALAGAAAIAQAQPVAPPAEQYRKAGEERAVNLCSTCHGPRGISVSPEFPILAAQRPGYLKAQIEAFRAQTRKEKAAHDFMYGIAGNLDEQVIDGIAYYYASQPPAPGRPGDPAMIAKGRDLFEKGLPERGIPPCASCHGARAEGSYDFPRLAGQHAKYVIRQVEYIQGLVRQAPVMHGIVKDLTPEEIQAIAVYVQSL